jgi:hypothetical protein
VIDVAGYIVTLLALSLIVYLLVRNPKLGESNGRVLALGVVIPFAVVAAFVGLLLLVG